MRLIVSLIHTQGGYNPGIHHLHTQGGYNPGIHHRTYTPGRL